MGIRKVMAGFVLAALLSGCASVGSEEGRALSEELTAGLAEVEAERPDVPGFAMAIMLPSGEMVSAATGAADPEGRPMTAGTPVRIASITKTFVAASVLRLWEDGAIDLDAPIGGLVSATIAAALTSDGYDTGAISVRHLLMHSGGLADHAGTELFLRAVFGEPDRVWTPEEQVQVLIDGADPVGAAGERFSYSDTGYVILGQIIEGITGEPLHEAVWSLTKLDRIGLEAAWWDEADERPQGVDGRAHQFADGVDTYGFHGSLDAFGGGGLIASTEDVARFYHALFSGEVFDDPGTLALMTSAPGRPEGSPYRIGLFTGEIGGEAVFSHGGFWGTYVTHMPSTGRTVSGVALSQEGYGAMRGLLQEVLGAEGSPAL